MSVTMTRFEFRKPRFLDGRWANLLHPLRLICAGERIPLTNLEYTATLEEGPREWWVRTNQQGRWGGGEARLGRLYVVWSYIGMAGQEHEWNRYAEPEPHGAHAYLVEAV